MPQHNQHLRFTTLARKAVIALGLLIALLPCAHAANGYALKEPPLTHVDTIDLIALDNMGMGLLFGMPGQVALQRPTAVAAHGPMVYIADAGARRFYRYNMGSRSADILSTPGDRLQGDAGNIHIDHDLTLIVTDPFYNRLYRFDMEGREIHSYADNANLSNPVAAATDPTTGNVVVADSFFNRLLFFNRSGQTRFASAQNDTSSWHYMVDMAQRDNRLYLLSSIGSQVLVYNMDGMPVDAVERTEVKSPSAIEVDPDGQIYIADDFDNTIKIYYDGKLQASYGGSGATPGRFHHITDLYYDQGLLYVADSFNRRVQVLRIDPFARGPSK